MLYLTDLEVFPYQDTSKSAGMDYLFPGEEKVFAKWFTGEIRVPLGDELQYVHMEYDTLYEKDLFLKIWRGRLKSERVVDNTAAFGPWKKG